MPLDSSGFGSQPNYQAMLIVPKETMEHAGHGCMKEYWIGVARDVFAQELNITPSEVYVTTSIEVTTGHLMAHKGKTCVLGVYPDEDPQKSNDRTKVTLEDMIGAPQPLLGRGAQSSQIKAEYLQTVQGDWIRNKEAVTRDFPKTTERLVSEGHEFNVALINGPYAVLLCKTDISQSRTNGQIALHPPLTGGGFTVISL